MFIPTRKSIRGIQFTGAPATPSTPPPQALYSDSSSHMGDQNSRTWSEIFAFIAKEKPSNKPKVTVVMDEIKKNKEDEKAQQLEAKRM